MRKKLFNPRSCAGHDIRPLFVPHFVDSGSAYPDIKVVHEGDINLYEAIQDFAEFVDIDTLIKRFNAGDVSALDRAQGFYGNLTSLPRDMRGIYELNARGKQYFDSLADDVKSQFNGYNDFISSSIEKLDSVFNSSVDISNTNIEEVNANAEE